MRALFDRYVEDGVSIGELARWLTEQEIPTASGKARWDRSTIWGMLRNPAYAGRAAFLKTGRASGRPAVTRPVRLKGQAASRHPATRPRPQQEWIEIAVPAIISEETFALAARRLEDNRRFAARNTKEPSLLQGLVACERCGYAYYRTSTRTTARKLYYYRCLGSDGWRYEHGPVCDLRPVRADELDALVWAHVTALLADPALIAAELDRRLAELRSTNPATAQRSRLELELTRTTAAIARLVEAYQEGLVALDELRARMPDLRKKQASLRAEQDALDAQLLDQETYLALAENLESFLARLRKKADGASVAERQQVLRLIVKEVLVGPQRVVIRHSIPTPPGGPPTPGYLLRGRSHNPTLRGAGRPSLQSPQLGEHARLEERLDERQDPAIGDAPSDPLDYQPMGDGVEAGLEITLDHPLVAVVDEVHHLGHGVLGPAPRPVGVARPVLVGLEDRLQHELERHLHDPVPEGCDGGFILPLLLSMAGFGVVSWA